MLHDQAGELDIAAAIAHFNHYGYARLGPVLSAAGAAQLSERAAAYMQGTRADPGLFFQHDSPSGRYEDLAFGAGWTGPSLAYRKLERLELDPLFLAWIENPLFGAIARRLLGSEVKLYRAVVWNKTGGGGTELPWHQDDGRFWGLDRAPMLQIWTALDDAPIEAGCVEVVPGSHHGGLASAEGGTVPPARLAAEAAEERAVALPARAGEGLLIHNHIWHRSRRNTTEFARRGLGISYLSGATTCERRRRAPRRFRTVFAPPPD